jgi:hypothetical protein
MDDERQTALGAARAAFDEAYKLCKAMDTAEKVPFRATILAARAAVEATLTAARAAEEAALAIDAEKADREPGLMLAHQRAMLAAESARQYALLKLADLALLTGALESIGPEARRSDGP